MFDLNQEIAQWKRSIGQSESVTGPDLNELESHLRDQIDHLSLAGLSLQEALLVARHRIGDNKRISSEFAKVNGSAILRRRLQWMLVGVLAYLLIFNLSHLASVVGVLAAYGAGFHGYLSGWIGQAMQLLVALIGLVILIVALKTPVLGRLARSAAGGVFIGSIVIVGTLLLIAARMGIPLLTVRTVGPDEFGQSAVIQNISELAYSVVIPILVVTVLFLLRRSARQQELGVD